MVIAGSSRQLFKTRGNVSFSKNFPFGSTVCKVSYKNYSTVSLNSAAQKSLTFVRLWCSCRSLHFSKETTRSHVTKLTPQESFRPITAVDGDVGDSVSNRFMVQTSNAVRSYLIKFKTTIVSALTNISRYVGGHLETLRILLKQASRLTDSGISLIDFLVSSSMGVFDPSPDGNFYKYGVVWINCVKVFLEALVRILDEVPSKLLDAPLQLIDGFFDFILKFLPM